MCPQTGQGVEAEVREVGGLGVAKATFKDEVEECVPLDASADAATTAALVGEFTSPSGKMVTVEGFHDGGDTWRLRCALLRDVVIRFSECGHGSPLCSKIVTY